MGQEDPKSRTPFAFVSQKIPVTLIFYRRPERFLQVLRAVRGYRPETIYAIADGATNADVESQGRVRECREMLAREIDWPCRIERIFADNNLGLKERVESGLDRVFAATSFSIILEEDCVPRGEFFRFVESIREQWEGEEKIGAISGNCFLPASFPLSDDYFFSRYPHIWGWGTWARCWEKHDRSDAIWPLPGGLKALWPDMSPREIRYWEKVFGRVYGHQLKTWDYRWLLSFWRNQWIAVTPRDNLVENIGFGEGATNTRDVDVHSGVERIGLMSFPLRHSKQVKLHQAADQAVFINHYLRMEGKLSFWRRLRRSMGKRLAPFTSR